MASKRLGRATVAFENPPVIIAGAAIAGKKESNGPIGKYFDETLNDDIYGEKTWEKAESKLLKNTFMRAANKSGKRLEDIGYIFCGDLLNQCQASNYAFRESGVPFFGLYGACSTMAEAIALAAMSVDGGFSEISCAAASSHFCASEKQFRYPLEYGGQRTPTSQWTVTGSGAMLISKDGKGPKITHITTGKIVDMGICDINNMGAAMAPAAADTIMTHFKDTNFSPERYDLIITGDLGKIGSDILSELLKQEGFDISKIYNDCGKMIFDPLNQDVHSGGSGCGCSASVICSYILKRMNEGKLKRVLFAGTGALMSPLSVLQKESIPGICHAVTMEAVI